MRSFIYLLLFLPFGLMAQNASIKGSIFLEGEAAVGANVWLHGTQIGGPADADGHFSLEKVPAGRWTLKASAIGAKPYEQIVSVKAGETMEISISLQEDAMGLEEVVVTGTMQETYVSQSPVKIDVVPMRVLEKLTAPTNIVEAVRMVNGVQEVVACGVCFTNSISINGLPGAYTAVLLDGAPIYGNLASVYGLNGIPSTIVERFEVIKGPSSTLYGSEAVAGVINIITKDPDGQPRLSLDLMGTSEAESFGSASLTGKVGKFSALVGINYAYLNFFEDQNNDGFGDGANMDRVSLFSKWTLSRPSKKRFSISGKYYYEDRRNGVEGFLKDRAYKKLRGSGSVYGESIYTRRGEVFGSYEFAQVDGLKLDYSLSYHHQDSYYGAAHYVAKQSIAFSNLLYAKQLGTHSLLFGQTMRWNDYDDNTIATEADGRNSPNRQFIPGIFVQDEWKASNMLTLLAGARLDSYHKHGIIFSPRFNAKAKLSNWTTARANFGTGFRIVNLFTEDHAFVTGQKEVIIAETLRPESSYNFSLDLNHVYLLGKSEGTIDLNAYYTHFFNAIFPDYSQEGKIIYANTSGYAFTKGLGISINHKFAIPLTINLGINRQKTVEIEGGKSRNIPFAPQWSGVFSANYEWKKKGFNIAYTSRVTGNMALPEVYDLNESGIPVATPRPTISRPFALHNMQVGKSFSRIDVYVGLQNIFNMRPPYSPLVGYNDPNSPAGFSQYFDTSYAYAPLHGREMYIGIKWRSKR